MIEATGARIIVQLLERQGITTAAGIPGGSILPLYDELSRSSITHVLVRHEQAAGFIAQGIARTTGLPAVCLATSGPGAMNLLTAIADARSDSVPLVAITGQVNSSLIGTDAFQEADTFGLSFPITKHSVMVKSPEELLQAIPQAFEIAASGRPGPVLIDVPRDVQTAVCRFDSWPEPGKRYRRAARFRSEGAEFARKIDAFACALHESSRPVLYAGGGCNSPEAAAGIAALLEVFPMPVVSSLMGIGCVPESHPVWCGMVGMHGCAAANRAMYDSDLVLAAGVRFDDRATGIVREFCPDARILHIDIDAAEVNKILPASISVIADCESALPALAQRVREYAETESGRSARSHWLASAAGSYRSERARVPGTSACSASGTSPCSASGASACGVPGTSACGVYGKHGPVPAAAGSTASESVVSENAGRLPDPRVFIASVPELAGRAGICASDIIVTTDVGQHQMWTAQYYPVEKPRQLLTSGSLGTMGFGLPAAIGAALANPGKRVVCFSGDGSIMMNVQELATLAEQGLDVTVIVLENGSLGMVRQQQEFLFAKNYSACLFSKQPDLVRIASGFGIPAADVQSDPLWYEKAFPAAGGGPRFVRCRISRDENVYPFVPAGKPNIDAILN